MSLVAVTAVAASEATQPAGESESWTERARAAFKRARATDYAEGLTDVEQDLRRALEARPEDFAARQLEVRVLLAKHRFEEALVRARPLNQSMPDDVEGWGLVSDAAWGLGDYAEAERAAQWMLKLRSTHAGGLERGARLRELFGDIEGAREFWESALRLSLADEEERAWIGTQLAALNRRTGRTEDAARMLRSVLEARLDYQPALAEMARVRMAQPRYAEAAALLDARYRRVRRPDVQYEFAEALRMAGRISRSNRGLPGLRERGACRRQRTL
jgi:tetratricopeptide (TPR) repeat protein